jgi:ABC-2 type transport system ATP-binding protein
VEIEPHDADRLADLERVLAGHGEPIAARGTTAAIRLREGAEDVAAIVRALDAEGIAIHQLRLREPTLDDVFLAKTGRSLEGADEDGDGEA